MMREELFYYYYYGDTFKQIRFVVIAAFASLVDAGAGSCSEVSGTSWFLESGQPTH
jgi:hypothetical protein